MNQALTCSIPGSDGPQQVRHASKGLDLNQTGTDLSQKPPGKMGAQDPEGYTVKVGAQQPSSPTNNLPQGQSVQTGNPRVWPTDVFCLANAMFVKNVTELPTFKNRVISYQKIHISGCWKTSLRSQQIWQYWAGVPTQELLLGAEKHQHPFQGVWDTCSDILGRGGVRSWGSRQDHQGSLLSEL